MEIRLTRPSRKHLVDLPSVTTSRCLHLPHVTTPVTRATVMTPDSPASIRLSVCHLSFRAAIHTTRAGDKYPAQRNGFLSTRASHSGQNGCAQRSTVTVVSQKLGRASADVRRESIDETQAIAAMTAGGGGGHG